MWIMHLRPDTRQKVSLPDVFYRFRSWNMWGAPWLTDS